MKHHIKQVVYFIVQNLYNIKKNMKFLVQNLTNLVLLVGYCQVYWFKNTFLC